MLYCGKPRKVYFFLPLNSYQSGSEYLSFWSWLCWVVKSSLGWEFERESNVSNIIFISAAQSYQGLSGVISSEITTLYWKRKSRLLPSLSSMSSGNTSTPNSCNYHALKRVPTTSGSSRSVTVPRNRWLLRWTSDANEGTSRTKWSWECINRQVCILIEVWYTSIRPFVIKTGFWVARNRAKDIGR